MFSIETLESDTLVDDFFKQLRLTQGLYRCAGNKSESSERGR